MQAEIFERTWHIIPSAGKKCDVQIGSSFNIHSYSFIGCLTVERIRLQARIPYESITFFVGFPFVLGDGSDFVTFSLNGMRSNMESESFTLIITSGGKREF